MSNNNTIEEIKKIVGAKKGYISADNRVKVLKLLNDLNEELQSKPDVKEEPKDVFFHDLKVTEKFLSRRENNREFIKVSETTASPIKNEGDGFQVYEFRGIEEVTRSK